MRRKELAGQRFGKLLVVEIDPEYVPKSGRHARWLCRCDCGATISAASNHLIAGGATACSFACKNRIEEGTRFGNLTVLEMTDKRSKNGGSVMYKCKCDCGEELLVPSVELRAKRKSCCNICNTSFGEASIKNLLEENNIAYIQQYTFDDLYGEDTKHKFRFDFYLPDYNIAIEYDGRQHFEAIDYFGGEKEFKKTQERDRIKTNYCLDNNITIIRIPYTHKDIVISDLLECSSFIVKI